MKKESLRLPDHLEPQPNLLPSTASLLMRFHTSTIADACSSHGRSWWKQNPLQGESSRKATAKVQMQVLRLRRSQSARTTPLRMTRFLSVGSLKKTRGKGKDNSRSLRDNKQKASNGRYNRKCKMQVLRLRRSQSGRP